MGKEGLAYATLPSCSCFRSHEPAGTANVECVEAAARLRDEGFFSAATAARYVDEARVQSLDPASLSE